MTFERLSKALRVYQANSGMSQRQVAKEIGMTPESLRNKLRGRTEFKLSEINRLCQMVGMTLDEAVMPESA